MPIYVYETLTAPPRQFEVRQSMTEPALTKDPETGEPIRRVIMGGYGILQKGKPSAAPAPAPRGGGCCGGACGCHH